MNAVDTNVLVYSLDGSLRFNFAEEHVAELRDCFLERIGE